MAKKTLTLNYISAVVLARIGGFIPDRLYLKMRFRLLMNQKLNFDNPKTFNEKLNWLKVYNRQPWYTDIADKSKVKDYVKDIIGEEYLIDPTTTLFHNSRFFHL